MSEEFIKIKVVGDAGDVKKALKPLTDLNKTVKGLGAEVKKLRKVLKDVSKDFATVSKAAKDAAKAQQSAASATSQQASAATKGSKSNKDLAESEKKVAVAAKSVAQAQTSAAAASKSAASSAKASQRNFESFAKATSKSSGKALTETAKNRKEWEKERKLRSGNIGSDLVNKDWKTMSQVLSSQVKLRRNLGDKAFIANQNTLNASIHGGTAAMGRQLTRMEQYRTRLGVLRTQIASVATVHQSLAKNMQWTGRQMMVGLSVPIAVFGQQALSNFLSLDKQLTRVAKVGGEFDWSHGTGKALKEVRALKEEVKGVATELGHEWATASDLVAGLMGDWAAMGYSMNKSFTGEIPGANGVKSQLEEISNAVLRVATLGELDVSTATTFVQSTLQVFGPMFKEASSGTTQFNSALEYTNALMNEFNAIENSTALTLQDMADELPELAAVFKATNVTAGEGMALLAGMKSAGIPVNEAGTAMRTNITKLLGPTNVAKEAMDKLGFSMFNLDGQSKPGLNAMLELSQITDGMTDQSKWAALTDFFGVRSTAKMQTLMTTIREGADQLAKGVQSAEQNDFARAVSSIGGQVIEGEIVLEADWDGLAAQADNELTILQESSAYKFQQMKVGLKTVFQEVGGLIAPPVIAALKWFQGLLQKIMELPQGMKMFIATIAAAVAAMGPLIFVFAQMGLAMATLVKGFTYLMPKNTDMIAANMPETGVFDKKTKSGKGKYGDIIQEKDTGRIVAHQNAVQKLRYKLHELSLAFGTTGEAADKFGSDVDDATKKVDESADDIDASSKKAAGSVGELGDEIVDIADVADDIEPKQLNIFDDIVPENPQGSLFPDDAFVVPPAVVAAGADSAEDAVDAVDDAAKKQAAANAAAAGASGGIFGRMFAPFKNAAAGIKNTFSYMSASVASSNGALGKMRTIIGGVGAGLGNLAVVIGTVVGAFLKFIFIASIIGLVVGAIIFLVKGLKENWGKISKIIQPAIDALKNSFQYLVLALKMVAQRMMNVMGSFQDSNGVLGSSVDIWTVIGNVIAFVIQKLADFIMWLSKVVIWAWPLFEMIANGARFMAKTIEQALTGNIRGTFMAFGAAFFSMTKPIWFAAEFVVDKVIWMVTSVAHKIGEFVGLFSGGAGDAIKSWADNVNKKAQEFNVVDEIQWRINQWASQFKMTFVDLFSKNGEDGAEEVGPEIANKFNEGLGKELEDGAQDVANDWLSSFLGGVKSSLDEIVDRVREAAKKAFDDYIDEQISVYDAQIDALDALEEAERKLYATQEYLSRKKELLRKHELDQENYRRDRALAVYEGRIDDARMLDRDWENTTYDFNKDLSDIEEDRRRELVDEERKAQRDLIEKLKDAKKEELDIAKEAFEKQLELLTEYTPRTVAEWDKMIGDITSLLKTNGVDVWPGMFESGMKAFGEAITDANEDIRQDAFWSGKDIASEWLRGFADTDVIGYLSEQMSNAIGKATDSALADIADVSDAMGDLTGDTLDMGDTVEPEATEELDPNRPRSKSLGSQSTWEKLRADFDRGTEMIDAKTNEWEDSINEALNVDWFGGTRGLDVEGLSTTLKMITGEFTNAEAFVHDHMSSSGTLGSQTTYFWQTWPESVGASIDEFEMKFSTGWGRIQENYTNWHNTFQTNFENGWATIGEFFGSHIETFEEDFSNGWNRIAEDFGSTWETIEIGLEENLESIKTTISGWLEDVGSWFDFAGIDWGDTWGAFGETFGSIWEGIENAVRSPLNNIAGWMNTAVNWIVDGTNGLIDAVNGLSSAIGMGNLIGFKLPRANQHPTLLASGGQIPGSGVGNGFKTNGARAIVGEGNSLYPEFVIPTDPRYKKNATSLLAQASKSIGYESGGKIDGSVLGSEETFDPVQAAKDAAKFAARAAFSVAIPPIQNMINSSQMPIARTLGLKGLKAATSWAYAKRGMANVPFDNYPAMLHKKEMVLPSKVAESVRAMADGSGGTTIIQVENFIGQEAWFNEMMKEHDVKVMPAKKRASGVQSRRVVGYNGGR